MPNLSHNPVLLVMAIAVLAPLLAEIPIGFRIPVVVLVGPLAPLISSSFRISDRNAVAAF